MDKTKTERKRSLTLNLSDEEMAILEALADRQGMSKSAVLRQAIRAYAANAEPLISGGIIDQYREGRES